jgi:hypothetical protein
MNVFSQDFYQTSFTTFELFSFKSNLGKFRIKKSAITALLNDEEKSLGIHASVHVTIRYIVRGVNMCVQSL